MLGTWPPHAKESIPGAWRLHPAEPGSLCFYHSRCGTGYTVHCVSMRTTATPSFGPFLLAAALLLPGVPGCGSVESPQPAAETVVPTVEAE